MKAVLLVVTCAALGGCVDLSGNDLQPTTWTASLVPTTAHPGVAGQAAAVVSASGTDLGIGLSGAVPGAGHIWALQSGSCSVLGQQIGENADYPVLTVSDSGKAAAETVLGSRLAREGSYAVLVRMSTIDTARVACGELLRG